MWKFECKKHLIYILLAMLVGAFMFGVLKVEQDVIVEVAKQMPNGKELLEMPFLPYIVGAFTIGGYANGLLLVIKLIQKFGVNVLLMMVVFIFFADYFIMLGVILLIPTIIVCLFGWITAPNKQQRKQFNQKVQTVDEIEKVYRLHHEYDEEAAQLGMDAGKVINRISLLYGLGVVGFVLIFMLVEDFTVVMIAGLLCMVLVYQLQNYRQKAILPIILLLYENCQPEACASAIFALTKKMHKRKSFVLTQQLTQCMIYLNDPSLAIDVLVSTSQKKGNFVYLYFTLMAYAYYLLGDESMVKHQMDECENVVKGTPSQAMLFMKNQAMLIINNKLALMNQDFESVKKFYNTALPNYQTTCQKVDARYYLGLIAFLEKDYQSADSHFSFVKQYAPKMHMGQKAKEYLQLIEKLEDSENHEEEIQD